MSPASICTGATNAAIHMAMENMVRTLAERLPRRRCRAPTAPTASDRNIKLAEPEKVKELTGYVIGSIPPVHWQPPGFRTFIEASLLDEAVLGVGTGSWGQEIMIRPEDLIKACEAIVVDLTGASEAVSR